MDGCFLKENMVACQHVKDLSVLDRLAWKGLITP